ncbi:ATP-binding protein [Rhizobium lentis]|uniref:OmpR/PhoB-type domain-containing protein n=1 Tax=Rhizobium lentis TaxID=1138194 RepID=A0ABS7ICU3_9HYPH|nr:winged helix-turn-helix domain-containing protein [Rhizobium lentis]MBX5088356.1 hypothetical protein [Rhizobium lentis]
MADTARNGFFAFGPYRLYPAARTLTREDVPVGVGSRAFDMLVALVERQGDVISRRDLMAVAWPGLNVEDSNVRVQMAHLRRELHANDHDEQYIVSVAGRGYCFVAIAEWHEAGQQADPAGHTGNGPFGRTALNRALPPRLEDPLGRDENLADLIQTIGERRFVTVVGAGGVGKTTLAILAAHADIGFNRVHFIDLSSVSDGAAVVEEAAAALEVRAAQPTLDLIVGDLAAQRALLIFDNCEHVIDEAAETIVAILKATSDVHVLATSREAFRLPGEAVYLLRPLGVPPQTGRLTAKQALVWPSIQLFVRRAFDSGYRQELDDDRASTVAAICRRLDGNPLAIELAASRIGSYGLERVLDLLDNQLALSWRGNRYAHPRHQTVQSMLDWSYSSLSDIDQMALRRLSVFGGEFSLDAAVIVAGGDGIDDAEVVGAIGNLVDKSLLVMQPGDGPTQLKLPGITKTYAAIKLIECGEVAFVHQRFDSLDPHGKPANQDRAQDEQYRRVCS